MGNGFSHNTVCVLLQVPLADQMLPECRFHLCTTPSDNATDAVTCCAPWDSVSHSTSALRSSLTKLPVSRALSALLILMATLALLLPCIPYLHRWHKGTTILQERAEVARFDAGNVPPPLALDGEGPLHTGTAAVAVTVT